MDLANGVHTSTKWQILRAGWRVLLFGVVLTYYVPHAKTPNSKTSRCARRIYCLGLVFFWLFHFLMCLRPRGNQMIKRKRYFRHFKLTTLMGSICKTLHLARRICHLVARRVIYVIYVKTSYLCQDNAKQQKPSSCAKDFAKRDPSMLSMLRHQTS